MTDFKPHENFIINVIFAIIEGLLSLIIFFIAFHIIKIVHANRQKHQSVKSNNDIYMVIMIITLALACGSVSVFYGYNAKYWRDKTWRGTHTSEMVVSTYL